jgi:hypothetical protein
MLATIGLACVGCQVNTAYVYVDENRAVNSTPPPLLSTKIDTPKYKPQSATSFAIAGSPMVTEGKSTAEGAAKVKASIVANREKTYRSIVRRLHDAYVREADNLKAQQLAAFEPVRAKTMADAMKQISDAYVKYADAVGPKIARLAVTAGFPDPDSQGRRKPSGAEGLDTLAYDTSQTLRAEIAKLKADFKRYSDSTLRAADADVDAKLTELLASVDRQVGDIDAKAQEVAGREVTQAQAQLGSLLADRPPTPLPAIPETRVVVSSGAVTPSSVSPNLEVAPSSADNLGKVKHDLEIWLGVNRYVLRSRGHGRDATDEFIAWRNQFKLAASASP